MLLQINKNGLYCETGDFYVDPWRGVERAVITHGHSDHARWGSKNYLCSRSCEEILRIRLGNVSIESIPFGQKRDINGVKVSLHPAGHLLGSAQIRVEYNEEVWVVSGDYKRQPDATCEPFEPVKCHTFVTESTFGLPIYCWRPQNDVFTEINQWWHDNQQRGWTSILCAYALGKAQRLLAGIDASIGPILVHGSVERLLEPYRNAGIDLPNVERATPEIAKASKGKALVIAPPSALGTPWVRKFSPYSTAFASGWMQLRGTRRRRALDRGFAISDHVDWDGIMETIKDTGAERVWVTHGYTQATARYLAEQGYDATAVQTRFIGEMEEDVEPESVSQR